LEIYKNLSLENINGEIWKVLSFDNDDYSISNFGRVKSNYKKTIRSNGREFTKKEKILKQCVNKFGYLQVAFLKSEKLYSFKVHRLVASYFIENKNNLKQINHIDKIKTNNKLENLEWVSNIENSCHRVLSSKKSSKFIGVSFCNKLKKWRSKIFFNKKQIHLGVFECEIEAHLKRVEFEKLNGIINNYNKI